MNVIVIAMVVIVVVSSTLEYIEAIDGDITNEKLCEDIRLNKLRILTMGTRGRSPLDAHFYILVEGGYMFKLPLANLHLDEAQSTTFITIDRDYIRADALFDLARDAFSRHRKFFLISDSHRNMFVGRMFRCDVHNKGAILLYDLDGIRHYPVHPQHVALDLYNEIDVLSSLSVNSNVTYAFRMYDSKLERLHVLEAFDFMDWTGLNIIQENGVKRIGKNLMMDFSRKTDIVNVFYYQKSTSVEAGYYFFLDSAGLVTVTRRKKNFEQWPMKTIKDLYSHRFEVNLKSFIVCDFQAAKSGQKMTPATTQTRPPTGMYILYWAVPLGAFVLGGIALFAFWIKQRHRKKKNNKKKNKQDDTNLSSNVSSSAISSNATSSNVGSSACSSTISSFTFVSNLSSTSTSSITSKISSALQSVKSKITSLLKSNKSKQAKAVAKEKKSEIKVMDNLAKSDASP